METLFISIIFISPFAVSGFYITKDLISLFSEQITSLRKWTNLAYMLGAAALSGYLCYYIFDYKLLNTQQNIDYRGYLLLFLVNLYLFVIIAGAVKTIIFTLEHSVHISYHVLQKHSRRSQKKDKS